MTRILLTRHAETEYNDERILQGQTDVPLNEKGKEQARKLAERLSSEPVDALYSSDLERARGTAEIVAEELGLEPRFREELREREYGEMVGEPHTERRKFIEDADGLDDFRPEEGENLEDIRQRVSPLIEDIREEHPDGTVIVIAHGWVNRAMIMSILEAESGRAHSIRQGNTCINEFEHESYRGWRINSINDTSHLG